MTNTTTWRRALAALLAAGLLAVGACGGDDDDAKTKDKSSEDKGDDKTATDDNSDDVVPDLNPDAPEADSKFCKDAITMIQASYDPNYEASSDSELAAALKLDPPDEIADSWTTYLTAARDIEKIDINDPEAAAKASETYERVQGDLTKILDYLEHKCGIDPNPGDSGASDGSTVTTGG
jgi:hypothetical protein